MIKNFTIIEKVKDSRDYRLILSPDSPLGECYDVLTEMRGDILRMINELEKKDQNDPEKNEDR